MSEQEDKPLFYERVEYLGPNSKNDSRSSDKFYEITITQDEPGGKATFFYETRRWGKYGSKGQTKKITHWYEYAALRSAKQQIRKKRDKGYGDPIGGLTRLAQAAE